MPSKTRWITEIVETPYVVRMAGVGDPEKFLTRDGLWTCDRDRAARFECRMEAIMWAEEVLPYWMAHEVVMMSDCAERTL